jgi:hypothetical protein
MGKPGKMGFCRIIGTIGVVILYSAVVWAQKSANTGSVKVRADINTLAMTHEIRQPYQYADEWKWVAPINGPGYCGPASLYHVIHYFKDFGVFHVQRDSSGKHGGAVDMADINRKNPGYIDHSSFGRFIQPNGMGSNWTMMKKVGLLFRSANNIEPFYSIFVCSSYTKPADVESRKARLTLIRDRFLNRNIPVVIHLRSRIPFYGHYVTLVGYDEGQSMVYYVDSLKNEAGISKVSGNDFLKSPFYESGRFYKARWDGEWMAIWHPELGIACGQCGE